jgi:16S rRNA (guanine527-N7)-methyltransferase
MAELLAIRLDAEQNARFDQLTSLLLEWNRRVNLTAITNPADVTVKHFLDSLTLVPVIAARTDGGAGTLIDVGAGAGLPGLALAIAQPALQVTLLEATGKKVEFIRAAIETLGLNNAVALHGRAEEVAQGSDGREPYDLAVARAVGSTASLVELLVPLVRVGGWALLMKGTSSVQGEINDATGALHALHAHVEEIVDTSIPAILNDRAIVVVQKLGLTPKQFPRRAGLAQRRPIRGPARD